MPAHTHTLFCGEHTPDIRTDEATQELQSLFKIKQPVLTPDYDSVLKTKRDHLSMKPAH